MQRLKWAQPNTIFKFESNNKQHVIYADFKAMQALVHIPICTYIAKLSSIWLVGFLSVDKVHLLRCVLILLCITDRISHFILDIIPTVLFCNPGCLYLSWCHRQVIAACRGPRPCSAHIYTLSYRQTLGGFAKPVGSKWNLPRQAVNLLCPG